MSKKSLIFIILLLISFSLSLSAAGEDLNSRYLTIDQTLAQDTTDPARPATNLVDGDYNTVWGFGSGAQNSWTEVTLSNPSLIYGLELAGELAPGTELTIQYRQEGFWRPFLAPTFDQVSESGFIDLSYDQIVTKQLRFKIEGNLLDQSYLSELKIVGEPADEVYHQIGVTSIVGSGNTDLAYPAEFLMDGNTYTMWKTRSHSSNGADDSRLEDLLESLGSVTSNSNSDSLTTGQVLFELEQNYKIHKVNMYLTDQVKGDMIVEAYQAGSWQQIDYIAQTSQVGWYQLNLREQPLTTSLIRCTFEGAGGSLGGVSEVSLWGTGPYSGKKYKSIGIQQERLLDQVINRRFDLIQDELSTSSLELAVSGIKETPLMVEINGREVQLNPAFNLRGYTIFTADLTDENLVAGENHLRIEPHPEVTAITNVRLNQKNRLSRQRHSLGQLDNGVLFDSGLKGSQLTLELNSPDYQLPEFPEFLEPAHLSNKGFLTVGGWAGETVITEDGYYEELIVNSNLQIDTTEGDITIGVKVLEFDPHGSISIVGPGKVTLYLESNLDLKNKNWINGSGDEGALVIYHTGSELRLQGGYNKGEEYKLAGEIYTQADFITLEGKASIIGKLYAQNGTITVTGRSQVIGSLLTGGDEVRFSGSSTFNGVDGGLCAPSAQVYFDDGVTVQGELLVVPMNIHFGEINSRESVYRIPGLHNFETKLIEEVNIFSMEEHPYVDVYYHKEDMTHPVYEVTSGLRNIKFSNSFITDQLLLENSDQFTISEIQIKGSEITHREPSVQILYPKAGQNFTPTELEGEMILGYVDNSEAEVQLNGKPVYQRGHYFWYAADQLSALGAGNVKITVVARDEYQRVDSDQISILVEQSPLLTVDQGHKLIHTKQDIYTISGRIHSPLNQLLVNGKPVTITDKTFRTEVPLEVGFNLVQVEAFKEDFNGQKELDRTIYCQILRLNGAIELTIDSPVDGYYTANDPIWVSGMIESLGDVAVQVNSQSARIEGSRYISEPVDLEEGSNLITIKASSDQNSIERQIIVFKDTIAPSIDEVSPENWYISNTSQVDISGEVSDASPLWIYANGKGSIVNGSTFTNQLTFLDGMFSIEIKAVDLAGNEAFYHFNVIVDTTPPETFEVIPNPADWTNNTQPIIDFETTDATSGISHYELVIDEGTPVTISSPYQLPPLADGVHNIAVTAIDRAGWRTTATTKVYIDTTPPAIPDAFEAIPGDDRVILEWNPNIEVDFVKYRLYRQPAYSNGNNYIELGKDQKTKYIDEDVVANSEYGYSISSVDHVGNESEPTPVQTVTTAPVVAEINPEEEIRVKYDEVEVYIPAGAVDVQVYGTDLQIRIGVLAEGEIPVTQYPIMGKTYQFDLLDGNGQVIKNVKFLEPVTIEFTYNPQVILDDYTPFDLDIFYYDPSCTYWTRMPKTEVDLISNSLILYTDHFSDYNYQLITNYSPEADRYKDLGLSPYQEYFDRNQEYIAPASGNLILDSTDLTLAGRKGLDLVVGRTYDNYTMIWDRLMEVDADLDTNGQTYAAFGYGWRLKLPRVEKTDHGEYLYLSSGSAQKLEWEEIVDPVDEQLGWNTDRTDYELEYRQGTHFTGEKFQTSTQTQITITLKDGTVYTFDEDGKIVTITDRTGNNTIYYYYNGNQIDRIIDSVGREIDFDYNASDRIKAIRNGDITYQYIYDNQGRLAEVIDPENRKTEYTYRDVQVEYGSEYNINYSFTINGEVIISSSESGGVVKNRTTNVLEEVIYPTGAKTSYDYQITGPDEEEESMDEFIIASTIDGVAIYAVDHYDWYSKQVNKTKVMVVEKKQYFDQTDQNHYSGSSYSYQFSDEDPANHVEWTTVTGAEGQKQEYRFNDDSTNIEKRKYIGDEVAEKEVYQYHQDLKVLEQKWIYCGSTFAYSETYQYDNWGNVISYYNSETQLTRYMHYLNTDSSLEDFPAEFVHPTSYGFEQETVDSDLHHLMVDSFVLNINPVDGSETPVQSHLVYSSDGDLVTSANWDQQRNKWVTESMEYDKYGNLKKRIDPLGYVTEISYSPNNTYPVKVIQKGIGGTAIQDADGNPISNNYITAQTKYDFTTGQKEWEIDGEGYLTEYEYDLVGRVVKVKYPDDNDSYSGDLGNLTLESYTNRTDNPIKIQYYDDGENQTTVAYVSGDLAITASQITNNVIQTPLLSKSRYYYDGLNRWVKMDSYNTDADGNQEIYSTYFYYDRANRRTALQDAEGYITFINYDELDRQIEVIYPDGSKDLTSPDDNDLSTKIIYDPVENKKTIEDAKGNLTIESKDWSGNVKSLIKRGPEKEQVISFTYDSLGNRVELINPAGGSTQYNYDSLGRMTEEIYPEDTFVSPVPEEEWDTFEQFTEITVRPQKVYFYNDLGQKIREITPNGYQMYGDDEDNSIVSNYTYDAVGNLIKVENVAGNISKFYYDRNGNLVKTSDPQGEIVQKMYTARGLVRAESIVNGALDRADAVSDETGDNDLVTLYEYDQLGNLVAKITPLGISHQSTATGAITLFSDPVYEHNQTPYYQIDSEYKKEMGYDHLSRLISETKVVNGDTIATTYQYDKVGNPIEVYNAENQRVSYRYTPQYWLEKAIIYGEDGKEHITDYEYDRVGNLAKETDPSGIWKKYIYDGLNQLKRTEYPDNSTQLYEYDQVGNKIREWNRRNRLTTYEYNTQNKLMAVVDADQQTTTYSYDLEGNLMEKVLPENLSTKYLYNFLNQQVREIRPEGGVIQFSYDQVGNQIEKIDRKDQKISYSYRRDNLPIAIRYFDSGDTLLATKEFQYDRNGNRSQAIYDDSAIVTVYDPFGRVESEERTVNGTTYSTFYQYDKVGNLTGIKYPGSSEYLDYSYNQRGQLVGVEGIADGTSDNPAFTYLDNGFLAQIKYNNNTITTMTPDVMGRVEDLTVHKQDGVDKLLDLTYEYDPNNNVGKRTNNLSGKANLYTYDNLDQLTIADLEGTFYGERTGYEATIEKDILGDLSIVEKDNYLVKLDYKASSVGVILMEEAEIGRIELVPDATVFKHRIKAQDLSIYYSYDNLVYQRLAEDEWSYLVDDEGKIIITLKDAISALAFKVHCKYDDRNIYNTFVDESTFYNDINNIINLYQRLESGKLEYDYDVRGNRVERDIITGNEEKTNYDYYPNSDRLKRSTTTLSGEVIKEWYYIYDENGNMVGKGTEVVADADGYLSLVKDTVTSRYWEYAYTADNRLVAVSYMGETLAEYAYDAVGNRIKSITDEGITSFVYNKGGKVIFEEMTSASDPTPEVKQTSFVYAVGKQIAKVGGRIGSEAEVIYNHHDNLGSTRLMTDGAGVVVFDQDYLPFGGDLPTVKRVELLNEVGQNYKFTGQRQEAAVGLYYYGARFYDPDLGRFITEDTYLGEMGRPKTQHLYLYVLNNPMKYVDPTGHNEEPTYDTDLDPYGLKEEDDFSLDIDMKLESLWKELCEGVFFIELEGFLVVEVLFRKMKENNLGIETFVNNYHTSVIDTIKNLSNKDNVVVAVNGTYFSPPNKAFGHIVNNGVDMTRYDTDIKNLGNKINFVEDRHFIGLNESGFFIGLSDYDEKGNILKQYPGLQWALGGGALLKENGKIVEPSWLLEGRQNAEKSTAPGFSTSQLYKTKHTIMGVKNNNLYIIINKKSMGVRPGDKPYIYDFINDLGLTDALKFDGGGSSQLYLNNGFDYQGKNENRAIPNMVLIKSND